jgi:hypothetical protein
MDLVSNVLLGMRHRSQSENRLRSNKTDKERQLMRR